MNKDRINNYLQLETYFDEIGNLNNILSIINWDYSVNLPRKSASSRQKEIKSLSSTIHNMLVSDRVAALIAAAEDDIDFLNDWQNANLKKIRRDFLRAKSIGSELQARHIEAVTACEFIWREARKNNDFNLFVTHFQKVLTITKEIAAKLSENFNISGFDALIDSYDPERRSAEIKSSYELLKKQLPSLITKILSKQEQYSVLPLSKPIDIPMQRMIAKKIMSVMGFDFDLGRIDESTHPFCSGTPNDVRLTTRYDENNFLTGLLGVIHETGHALYELNLPSEYKNQPVGNPKGMAFHESQSLIMEMQVAKTRDFTEFLSKLLRDDFHLQAPEYSGDNLYKLLTRVKPDFIRVDADEVTYPLHVIMRFEIEEALIEGDLAIQAIPELWNQKMQEYLDIKPKTDSEGCLQDIHWSWGAFGYFPSYTNGAMIAAQIMAKAKQVEPNIQNNLQNGDFSVLNSFLNKNLRQYGSLKNSSELLYQATNFHQIKPEFFIDYLSNKYL